MKIKSTKAKELEEKKTQPPQTEPEVDQPEGTDDDYPTYDDEEWVFQFPNIHHFETEFVEDEFSLR